MRRALSNWIESTYLQYRSYGPKAQPALSRLGLSSLLLSLFPFWLEESSLNDKPTWTLLLTDPNRMARTTLTRQLTYYGYAVLEADSGRQAVGIFQKQPSAIDLILLDTSIAAVSYTHLRAHET